MPRSSSSMRHLTLAAWCLVVALPPALQSASRTTPKFYDDDPLWIEVDTEDASGVQGRTISLMYDLLENLFAKPGGSADDPGPAQNINTVGEVPDSSWFTNRIGAKSLTAADVARGPDRSGPAPGPWTVVSTKTEGITPGFTVLDSASTRWFVKFDPPGHAEMATGAEIVSTKIFHALGYFVPENVIATISRDSLLVGDTATITTPVGRRRLQPEDIDQLLKKGSRNADGSYRVIASKALEGRPLGGFSYYGTRPDDPNDVVPHEHRRELRGLRVFAAWLNHVDSKSINTLDTLIDVDGRKIVRHHLLDFGSTLGSAAVAPRPPHEGHEYLYDPEPTWKTAVTLGFNRRPFTRISYPDYPSVGRFEGDHFVPDLWKPRVPNPAFLRMQPEDAFWAARLVMAFEDDHLRASVGAAQYSDPEAADYLVATLAKRRDAIGRTWLTGVNPIVDARLDEAGVLTFRNAAVDAGVADAPKGYRGVWAPFANETGEVSDGTESTAPAGEALKAPMALPSTPGTFVRVAVSAVDPPHPTWGQPVHLYFKRVADGWKLVGLMRRP